MTTNKKILRSLGIALLAIWGIIAYQIVSAIYSGKDEEQMNDEANGDGTLFTEMDQLENLNPNDFTLEEITC